MTGAMLPVSCRSNRAGMITLYHHPFCPHSRFIRLVLGEMGIEPRLVEEKAWERRTEFLMMAPEGATPVMLDDDGPSLSGAAVIAEWRGLPYRKMRPDRWQSPAELVPKLMQRLGLRERLHETEVIDAWSKIVGDFIAAHSAPVALREGVLYVRVLQPALHYELEQVSKSEILRKLKQRFGSKTIRDVRFRVG